MAPENIVSINDGCAGKDRVESEEEYAPPGDPLFTRVAAGSYVVGLISCRKRVLYRSPRWQTTWRIVEGPEAGKELFFFIPALPKGGRPKPGYKMYGVYCIATDRRPPRDLWRRNPESFLRGALFEARVGQMKQDFQGTEIPEPARYSVIRVLVRRVDGCPKECEVQA
ncbi:MAG: hypothetical protein ACQGVK_02735 [Myxococcota bacterium]